jgi:hypothetical protein
MVEKWNLIIYKEQVEGTWERFSTAKSNAAAGSRCHLKKGLSEATSPNIQFAIPACPG